jgi:hypothetical protein
MKTKIILDEHDVKEAIKEWWLSKNPGRPIIEEKGILGETLRINCVHNPYDDPRERSGTYLQSIEFVVRG